jgi:hypothetical protein
VRVWLWIPFLVAFPVAGAGQNLPAPSSWTLTVGGDGIRFGSVARDALSPAESAADLRPSARAGLRATLARAFGPWRVQFEAGWAEGEAEVGNETVVVRDKTLDLSRYRISTALERRLAELGTGELTAALAPTLDLWQASGNNRQRFGVECRLAVRVPLGKVALENRLAFGLSGSPLDPEDLGDGFETEGLRWLAFGVGLSVPL